MRQVMRVEDPVRRGGDVGWDVVAGDEGGGQLMDGGGEGGGGDLRGGGCADGG